jgi:hypothetical protein
VFDFSVDGHHLEYLNHLYIQSIKVKSEKFIFFVPRDFIYLSKNLVWPASEIVEFVYFDDFNKKACTGSALKRAYDLSILLGKLVGERRATSVFVVSLMELMPFIPFVLGRNVKISGIVYLIYLYRWKKSSFSSKVYDVFKYVLFSYFGFFQSVFLLNDEIAPPYLNKKFNTKVFKYLPDPIMSGSVDPLFNLKSELEISVDNIVISHFGVLSRRKGTLRILEAILNAGTEEISKLVFVFAGKIDLEIKDAFYDLLFMAQKKCNIIVIDEYLNYQFICNLAKISNFVLTPYSNTEQSSGVLSYCAKFNVPIVAPNSGLLGKLVRRNKLGFLLEDNSVSSIVGFFKNCSSYEHVGSNHYIVKNTIDRFSNIIFTNIG